MFWGWVLQLRSPFAEACQLPRIYQEKSSLVKMRTELEKAANRLEQERIASDRRQVGGKVSRTVAGDGPFTALHRPPCLTGRRLIRSNRSLSPAGPLFTDVVRLQAEELAKVEEWRANESQRLARERRVLEKQVCLQWTVYLC